MSVPLLSFAEGETGEEIVPVHLDTLVTSKLLIQANSGGGKSRALRYLLEQTHGRVQHFVFDPEGEFSTLRERFPYVLVGKEGEADIAAHPSTAAVLCRRLMEMPTSAVFDLSDLSITGRREFVAYFLTALMALPRELWHPLFVVIDEAHIFAPEGSAVISSEAVVSLCVQGRKRGFCPMLAVQRLSRLDKDVAAELTNRMIGRTGLDVDMRRAGEALGFDQRQRATLKSLRPGEFYVYGPAISNEVVLAKTGPVLTTHHQPGQIGGYLPPPPPAAIQSILALLQTLPQEESEDLGGAGSRSGAVRIETRIEYIEVPVFREGEVARMEAVRDDLRGMAKDLLAVAQQIDGVSLQIDVALDKVIGHSPVPNQHFEPITAASIAEAEDVPTQQEWRSANLEEPAVPPSPPPIPAGAKVTISNPQQKLLNALALMRVLGVGSPSRDQLAFFRGVKSSTGSFNSDLTQLKTKGLIDFPRSGCVTLTETGSRQAAPATKPPTRQALQRQWLSKFSNPQAALLSLLIEAYPRALSRQQLADRRGVKATTGSFNADLTTLREAKLVDYPQQGYVIATKLLFPEGLQ